ncbi:hypothetical protein Tsubulata_016430 [Turnera subulata]|uniref:CDT1 Geminin-binding domain-containing protein n=1 Tax=Turnera subulata TaxID=218843 RepID=A0A9Q0J0N2_9ROSI|nr:hypothetical protein Tsubulata_016430 [Turnera subulata]
MEERKCSEGGQRVLDFQCKKIVPEVEKSIAPSLVPKKPGVVENENPEIKFVFQTPEKTNQPLLTKSQEGEVEDQERFKVIMEVFDAMVYSLRLLGLRKRSPTLQNIRAQVEVLTQREFQNRHLAQIKYILPDVIQIEKIMVHDKKTLCMKPDMEVILSFDVVEGHQEPSDFYALRGVFASRLIHYFTKHPEVSDVPQATLPHLFNQQSASVDTIAETPESVLPDHMSQTSQSTDAEKLLENAVPEDLTSIKNELLTNSSHLHPSFCREFSRKFLASEKENPELLASPLPLLSLQSDVLHNEDITITGLKNGEVKSRRFGEAHMQSSKLDGGNVPEIKADQSKESPGTYPASSFIDSLPDQPNSEFSSDASVSASPLCKSVSAADTLTIETPAPSVPRRATPSTASQKQTSSHTSAKKSLDFSCSEGDDVISDCYHPCGSNTQNLPGPNVLFQKVDESHGFRSEDHKTDQSVASPCLPDLVSLISHIFHSSNSSAITKEELLHKILVNSFDFANRGEVEEQLEILEKLVPEWLCRKLGPSGDVLYSINKISDLDAVRDRELYEDNWHESWYLYSKLGYQEEALKVFDHIQDPDIVSYTCLLNLYLHAQLPTKALVVFSELINGGLRPDSFSVVGALSACGRSKSLLAGKVVHGMVFRYHLGSESFVGNALIDMYCRNDRIEAAQLVFKLMGVRDVSSWTSLLNGFVLCNDLVSAKMVFDEMPLRDSVAWTAMITGFVQGEMPIEALEMFREMKAEGVSPPTVVTVVAVLAGCADTGALDHGQAIHGYMEKVSLTEDTTVRNALMDMYSKGGCPELARKIFNGMRKKDVFSWTTMIAGYAFHGKGNDALELFHDMLQSRVIPNGITFLSVLSACSHSGLVVEAQRLFMRMIQCYPFEPRIEHYGCMVDLLGRAGLLEEAKEFIENMPVDPDAVIWRSLLGACLLHGNLSMAEMAGKKIIQLELNDDGVHVLLCNIYCSANRMEEALKMRKMMGRIKVKKKPAHSWIEVNGVVHEFLAEDKILSASGDVYFCIEMITDHLRLDVDFTCLEAD